MAQTSANEGFYERLKSGEDLSQADDTRYLLTQSGAGATEITTETGQNPTRAANAIDFVQGVTPTWQSASGTFSELRVQTYSNTSTETLDFCTVPLTTTINPTGTDVSLTSATLSLTQEIGALDLATQTNPTASITLVNDVNGAQTYVTSAAETNVTFTVDRTANVLNAVTTATDETLTGNTATYNTLDGVRMDVAGGSPVSTGSLTGSFTFTTQAEFVLTSYTITF